MLRQVLATFSVKDVGRGDAALVLDVALPALLAACGDMAVRTREGAKEAVAQLMENAIVKEYDFVSAALYARLPAKAAPREAQGMVRKREMK